MNKLLFVLLIILTGCSSTQAESSSASDDLTNKITTFWEYVSENENRLFTTASNNQATIDEMNTQIRLINENLSILISNELINNKKDLVISSGGNSDYFELCDRIAEKAPDFVYINPVSLIPPVDDITLYAIGNMVLHVEDIQVHFDGDNDFDLLFILSNNHLAQIQNDNSGQLYSIYMQALYLMTLEILGERTFGNKITSAEMIPLPIIIPCIPFMELRKYIEN